MKKLMLVSIFAAILAGQNVNAAAASTTKETESGFGAFCAPYVKEAQILVQDAQKSATDFYTATQAQDVNAAQAAITNASTATKIAGVLALVLAGYVGVKTLVGVKNLLSLTFTAITRSPLFAKTKMN